MSRNLRRSSLPEGPIQTITSAYTPLRDEVARLLEAGKDRARQAVEREKVQTYWEVGRVLHTHVLANKARAGYGDYVVVKLAGDVGMSRRNLYEMMQFHRTFPIVRARAQLTWTHYRALLRIPDKAERLFYAEEADAAGWSVGELEERIRAGTFAKDQGQAVEEIAPRPQAGPPLLPKRGLLYTYRVVDSPAADGGAGTFYLDLGFGIYYAPASSGKDLPSPGGIVETVREEDTPERYRFRVIRAGLERLYTYRAVVEEVVDGDTIWTHVDCGFRAWTRQKLRLRGIDTPELPTSAGRRAKDFVARALKEVPFVVLISTKPDKYDRYLSDLFYLPGATDPRVVLEKGTFLNQQLMERGLAVRFAD